MFAAWKILYFWSLIEQQRTVHRLSKCSKPEKTSRSIFLATKTSLAKEWVTKNISPRNKCFNRISIFSTFREKNVQCSQRYIIWNAINFIKKNNWISRIVLLLDRMVRSSEWNNMLRHQLVSKAPKGQSFSFGQHCKVSGKYRGGEHRCTHTQSFVKWHNIIAAMYYDDRI